MGRGHAAADRVPNRGVRPLPEGGGRALESISLKRRFEKKGHGHHGHSTGKRDAGEPPGQGRRDARPHGARAGASAPAEEARDARAPRVRSACPGCLDERLLHGHSRSLLPAASVRRAIASACASAAWKTPPRAQAPGGVDDRVRDALGDRDAARRRARPRRPRYRRRPRPSARWQGGRSADPWR